MKTDVLLRKNSEDGILSLVFNRPKVLNAFNRELCMALDDVLREVAEDNSVRCMVMSGAGDRAFSAGYDVKELATYGREEFFVENIQRYEWIWNIAAHPKPVIVANQGIAMGVGAIIAVSADIRIGTPESIIRFTGTPHGTAMLTWNLPQLVGWSKAKEYLMTSCEIDAEEAHRSGLLNKVVSRENLMAETLKVAGMIAACEPSGPQDVKRLMREGLALDQRSRMNAEMQEMQKQQMAHGNRMDEWYGDMVKK